MLQRRRRVQQGRRPRQRAWACREAGRYLYILLSASWRGLHTRSSHHVTACPRHFASCVRSLYFHRRSGSGSTPLRRAVSSIRSHGDSLGFHVVSGRCGSNRCSGYVFCCGRLRFGAGGSRNRGQCAFWSSPHRFGRGALGRKANGGDGSLALGLLSGMASHDSSSRFLDSSWRCCSCRDFHSLGRDGCMRRCCSGCLDARNRRLAVGTEPLVACERWAGRR